MRQSPCDIVIVEGNNELNVALNPLAPPEAILYGIVINALTGSPLQGVKITVNGLVTYTASKGQYEFRDLLPEPYTMILEKDGFEPVTKGIVLVVGYNEVNLQMGMVGKPYLVSVDLPQDQIEQSYPGHHITAPIYATGFVPASPENGFYQFLAYIYSDACAGLLFRSQEGSPAGFHDMSGHILSYGVTGPPPHYIYVPLGTYAVKTSCVLLEHIEIPGEVDEWRQTWIWKGVDTGLRITVVEAPPPEPDVYISGLLIKPTTVNVGEPVEIIVVVANRGEVAGSLTVTTTVNGIIIDTRTVTRVPGLYQGYFLYFTPEEAGIYLVEADGVTKSFTAY